MTSPVVVDGRLTREKLLELLDLAAEYPALDYKRELNLDDPHHRYGLLKDLIAMSNTGQGGYVVVGANEHGEPATGFAPVRAERFDSADLGQMLARHVVTAPVVSSQVHVVDDWTFVLIHVAPPANRLPILISRTAEYPLDGGKRMKVVLQEGVLYLREGSRAVAADDSHWPTVLEGYRRAVIADAREDLDILIRQVVSSMGDTTGGVRLSPLVLAMEEETFADAVEPHFDTPEGQRRLKKFIRASRSEASATNPDESARTNALTKLAIVAVQALSAEAPELLNEVIGVLHENYEEALNGAVPVRVSSAQYWLDVSLHVFAIGATAVRERAWWAIALLTNRTAGSYYAVWLRHALVMASRAGLLSGGSQEAALMLIRARDLASKHPALRPDLPKAAELESDADIPTHDKILNSLCQWDFIWCVVARVTHDGEFRDGQLFFPSCAALYQDRTQPVINQLATSEATRSALVPSVNVSAWAGAFRDVLDLAESQSHHYRGWWDGADYDDRVQQFIEANAG